MAASLWVALGGALGSVARHWVGLLAFTLWGGAFPWGTLIINVVGSFVIGAFAALTAEGGILSDNVTVRLLVMTGLCGGFTTFSSFSLQTMSLLRDGETLTAFANIALSVLICLAATIGGFAMFTRG